ESRYRQASDSLRAGDTATALRSADLAWAEKWIFPDAPLLLGYMAFQSGHGAEATRFYAFTVKLYDRLLGMAEDYRSLPEVKTGLLKSSAEPLVDMGVALERSGDRGGAEAAYLEAIRRSPDSVQAYNNLGAFYWGHDWAKAAESFRHVAELQPQDARAQ